MTTSPRPAGPVPGRAAGAATPRELQLLPASPRSRIWLAALTVGLPLLLVGGTVAFGTRIAALQVLGYVAAFVALLFFVIDRALHRHRLTLDATGLEIATTFYRQTLSLAELDIDHARVADLAERTEFKPRLKTNGVSLPGFHSGWFRLRNRSKAFVAVAGGPRVLWLPTTRGYDLLLQPRQPQALLQHLRELAAAPARG